MSLGRLVAEDPMHIASGTKQLLLPSVSLTFSTSVVPANWLVTHPVRRDMGRKVIQEPGVTLPFYTPSSAEDIKQNAVPLRSETDLIINQ